MTNITPRHTHRRLVKFWRTLDHLAMTAPTAIHESRVQALARLVDTVSDSGTRAKGHISDPTGAVATSLLDAGADDAEEFEAYMETLGLTLRLMAAWVARHGGVDVFDDANAPEHRRCGEYTPRSIKLMPWYTTPNQRGRTPAECGDDALYSIRNDGTIAWAEHGMCDADYRGFRRASIDAGDLERGQEWVA